MKECLYLRWCWLLNTVKNNIIGLLNSSLKSCSVQWSRYVLANDIPAGVECQLGFRWSVLMHGTILWHQYEVDVTLIGPIYNYTQHAISRKLVVSIYTDFPITNPIICTKGDWRENNGDNKGWRPCSVWTDTSSRGGIIFLFILYFVNIWQRETVKRDSCMSDIYIFNFYSSNWQQQINKCS